MTRLKRRTLIIFVLFLLILIPLSFNFAFNSDSMEEPQVLKQDSTDRSLKPSQLSQTDIILLSYKEKIKQYTHLNQSIHFYFNDTTNNEPVSDLNSSNVKVYDENNDLWGKIPGDHNWSLYSNNAWGYILNISILGYTPGNYNIMLNVSKYPHYNWSTTNIEFEIIGNRTEISLKSLSYEDEGVSLKKEKGKKYYDFFMTNDLVMKFTLIDYEKKDKVVSNDYSEFFDFFYHNQSLTGENGRILNSIEFNNKTYQYKAILNISNFIVSNYSIELRNYLLLKGYELSSFNFRINIKEKRSSELAFYYPEKITVGEKFNIVFVASSIENEQLFSIENALIITHVYINNNLYRMYQVLTDERGVVYIEITLPLSARNITFNVRLEEDYYYDGISLNVDQAEIIPIEKVIQNVMLLLFLLIFLLLIAVFLYKVKFYPNPKDYKKDLKKFKSKFLILNKIDQIFLFNKIDNKLLYYLNLKNGDSQNRLLLNLIENLKNLNNVSPINVNKNNDKGHLVLIRGDLLIFGLILNHKTYYNFLRNKSQKFIDYLEENINSSLNKNQNLIIRNFIEKEFSLDYILPYKINYNFLNRKVLLKGFLFLRPFYFILNKLKSNIFNFENRQVLFEKSKSLNSLYNIFKKTLLAIYPKEIIFEPKDSTNVNRREISILKQAESTMVASENKTFYITDILLNQHTNKLRKLKKTIKAFKDLKEKNFIISVDPEIKNYKNQIRSFTQKLDTLISRFNEIDKFLNILKDKQTLIKMNFTDQKKLKNEKYLDQIKTLNEAVNDFKDLLYESFNQLKEI